MYNRERMGGILDYNKGEKTMKNLIVYASKTGTAKKCAALIKEGLEGETDIKSINEAPALDFSAYDTIILGSPIYAGKFYPAIRQLIQTQEALFKTKRMFLYINCMDTEQAEKYIHQNLTPAQCQLFTEMMGCGGALYFSKMKFFEKLLLRKIANSRNKKQGIKEKINGKTDIEAFEQAKIQALIEAVNKK